MNYNVQWNQSFTGNVPAAYGPVLPSPPLTATLHDVSRYRAGRAAQLSTAATPQTSHPLFFAKKVTIDFESLIAEHRDAWEEAVFFDQKPIAKVGLRLGYNLKNRALSESAKKELAITIYEFFSLAILLTDTREEDRASLIKGACGRHKALENFPPLTAFLEHLKAFELRGKQMMLGLLQSLPSHY